jgi:hypothetical protein
MNAARTQSSAGWLFGPVPDLLLGCGLLYWVLFAAFLVAGAELRGMQAAYVFPALILLLSGPHYGATLVRVYEQRTERQRYAIFSVYATALVLALFVAGLYNMAIASWMATLYLTWSPWHYTGQNYGIGVMFLRRRSVDVTPAVKRWLYTSFVLSYAMTFLMIHAESGNPMIVPGTGSGAAVRFVPLGFPRSLANPALLVLGLAYLVAFAAFAQAMFRQGAWRAAGPTAALVVTQALWFLLPLSFEHFGWARGVEPLSLDYRGHYALWVVLGHAVQYLWVTAYYARASADWRGYLPYFGKVLATGTAIWTLPYVLFGPGALGPLSVDAGLLLLVAAAVNIHHFILDGAIWKLRHMRIANVLLRPTAAPRAVDAEPAQAGWGRRLVWHAAIASLAIGVFVFWQEQFTYLSAYEQRDFVHASAALDRLGWFGKDSATARMAVGNQFLRHGNVGAARQEFERSLALRETAEGHAMIGSIQEHEHDVRGALAAYERALSINPNLREVLVRAGKLQLALGRNQEARALLDRAAALEAVPQAAAPEPVRY